ncbi:Riboflavin biosynthesis protein RibF [Ephemeroptericola cinctiostellae]|uniref:Riboflavin biosynthesis protein n=1 Tax=Ephemeroptericola cinctiostellae TaxID=2268024 RepID=A0A345DBR7_9BURK|nr:bifunctional riboflavin kinase/FAD synthetase [Ephemeroptericola cinctiostellae]AXF85805.1 Riboflavin biosynthesis protein RibF [Ephemeroptericola cinctiostellae]
MQLSKKRPSINPSDLMNLIRYPTHHDASTARTVTIGNFDGVHRGHTAILDALAKQANQQGLAPTVITFDPNPKAFFAQLHGKPAPQRVSPLRDKITFIKQHGVNDVVLMRFNQALANMPATDFVEHILVESLNTRDLLIGDDFRFGAGRTGDFNLLQDMGEQHGFTVTSLHSVLHAEERISSTAVRTAIAKGQLPLATALLGHDYTLSGHIIYGQQLGRTIGIPTINLKMPDNLVAQGIFAVTVELNGRVHQGVASIGTRPSVKTNGQCWCEVYIFDFNETVYGDMAHVTLHHKIRDEAKFDGLDALMLAIQQDIRDARAFFAAHA